MQGEKTEAWFVSPAGRKYFAVESTTFLYAKKFTKNLPTGKVNCLICFFIGEAIKIAVSFSKFQCISGATCEITQNMVFQLLKNFKVEINFG